MNEYEALRGVQAEMARLPAEVRRRILAQAVKVRRIAATADGQAAIQLVHLEVLNSVRPPPVYAIAGAVVSSDVLETLESADPKYQGDGDGTAGA